MKTLRKQSPSKGPTIRYDRLRANRSRHNAKRINRARPDEKQEPLKLAYGTSGEHISLPIPRDEVQTQLSKNTARAWWVHLWSGLVRDPSGKHRKAIKQAVWLYLYLLVGANWRTGTLFRRIATISAETGLNERTVQRWLGTLRKQGYIKTLTNGRSLNISITKWRPISRKR